MFLSSWARSDSCHMRKTKPVSKTRTSFDSLVARTARTPHRSIPIALWTSTTVCTSLTDSLYAQPIACAVLQGQHTQHTAVGQRLECTSLKDSLYAQPIACAVLGHLLAPRRASQQHLSDRRLSITSLHFLCAHHDAGFYTLRTRIPVADG